MENTIDKLFENRDAVGARIQREMQNSGVTKSKLCKDTGISRPTLDKLLAGEITNKKNFDKHIDKIFRYLNIDLDKVAIRPVNIRSIRNRLHLSPEYISKATGISQERLLEIESGTEATISEYRDIAACLGTSTRALKNESFFENTTLGMESMFTDAPDDPENQFSAFWGHIGVLPLGDNKNKWYPISGNTRDRIYHSMHKPFIVVPCMNNRVLLLNMKNIKKLYLLDEALDAPDNTNWDPSVSEGEIPLVVYEAMDDYFFNQDNLSDKFIAYMDELVKSYGWTDTSSYRLLHTTTLYFNDGQIETDQIEFGDYESLTDLIAFAYEDLFYDEYPNVVYFSEIEDQEHILPLNNISMIECPLLKVEEAIFKTFEEE